MELNAFLFEEACRLEQTSALSVKAEQFLKERKILKPSDDTLQRLIGSQRRAARQFIFKKLTQLVPPELVEALDLLLNTQGKRYSDLHLLKQPPGRPSPAAILKLIEKIEKIEAIGVSGINLSWLSNNFQRSLARYAKRSDANRLREIEAEHRYAALVCFLVETLQDTIDCLVDMYDKLITKIYNHAQEDVDDHNRAKRKKIRESLASFACIVYWQAQEINRVILECDPGASGVDLSLMEHISPITWDNIILYGEYVLNRGLIRL